MSMFNKVPDAPNSDTSAEGDTDKNVTTPNPDTSTAGKDGTPPEGQDGSNPNPDTDDKGNKDGDKDFKTPRPDNIPEKFWDPEKGIVKQDDLVKSYGELERKLAKAQEKPKAPEKYEYKTPEKLRTEFGLSETVSDDAVLNKFNEYAKTQGLSQEQYSGLLDVYLEAELEEQRAYMNAEFGKLGTEKEAIKRVGVLKRFGKQYLSKEANDAMAALTNSSAAVKLFEELAALSTKQRQPVDQNPNTIDDGLSEAELNALMKTDAYWNKKDPEHVQVTKTVTEGFKRLESRR